MNKKALVLLSGGQDSTTCLFWAIKEYGADMVSAVGFSYGQKHIQELEIAREICAIPRVPYEILDLSALSSLSRNALTNHNIKIENFTESKPSTGTVDIPNTFVPGRNLLFLSFAAAAAYQRGITDIIIGVSQADYSGYPDCREAFIIAAENALRLSMDHNFNIITPLINLDKSQVWALSEELGCFELIKEKTLTCYNGVTGEGCKKCPACVLRRRGLERFEALPD